MPDSASRSLRARLAAAVESAPSGLLMTDADGRIVLVNREIERMFGYPRDELVGQPVEMLVPQAARAQHPASRATFRQDPQVRAMGAGRDLYGLHRDGSEVPVEIGLTPVSTEEGQFVLGAVVDITERKRLEREQHALSETLRQAQKMEAVGTLAGGIAHDFNNILGAIVGYTELLLDEVPADSRTGRDIAEILAAARRGRTLVDRMLTFSRRQEASMRPVDLRDVVREVQPLLRASVGARIAIEVDQAGPLPAVLADSTSVHQILMNLAANAAQAMPDGGRLSFELAPMYVRDSVARAHPGLREGEYVAMTVRDSGSGMDETTRARAFEPFFTTKGPGQGTGLGLAMVYGIMQDHAGAVPLDSAPGAGTAVQCLFPVPPELDMQAATAIAESGAMRTDSGHRVLYVDDEPTLLDSTRRRLERHGFNVSTANGPAAALALIESDPAGFDLVLTDLWMPEMSGIELARALTARQPGLPIILLSGFVADASDPAVAAAGVRRVLQKPVLQEELVATCLAVLDERDAPH